VAGEPGGFEPTWARLAEQTHLVAIDLPGFRHSQRRNALLSPKAMGEFVIRLADALGAREPARDRPRRGHRGLAVRGRVVSGGLLSPVVGGGRAAFPLRLDGVLKEWVDAPDLEGYSSADPRQIVAGALTDIERYVLLEFVREAISAPLRATGSSSRCATCRTYPTEPTGSVAHSGGVARDRAGLDLNLQ
jgi:hypothetical protein